MPLPITAIYAGILALFMIALAINVTVPSREVTRCRSATAAIRTCCA